MLTYGGQFGIVASHARIIDRSNDGLTFTPTGDDYFGWEVASGDFDGDHDDDLAIGIRKATCPNGIDRAGAVVVLNGSSTDGITNAGSHIWRPGVQGIAGDCATSADFGLALASGHFDTRGFGSDAWDDLAIGAPDSDAGAGAVHVLYGSSTGLASAGNQRLLPPALPGIVGGAGKFGSVLATGVLNFECLFVFCAGDSLVVSAPYATVNGMSLAGAVWVFDSADADGINVVTVRPILPLAPLGIAGPHGNDQFGNALAIGDFNDDDRPDIAIGVSKFDDGADEDAGAVQVLYQTELLFVDGFD